MEEVAEGGIISKYYEKGSVKKEIGLIMQMLSLPVIFFVFLQALFFLDNVFLKSAKTSWTENVFLLLFIGVALVITLVPMSIRWTIAHIMVSNYKKQEKLYGISDKPKFKSRIDIGENARQRIENKVENPLMVTLLLAAITVFCLFMSLQIFFGYLIGIEIIVKPVIESPYSIYELLEPFILIFAFSLLLTIIAHLCTRFYERKLIAKEERRVGEDNLVSWKSWISVHDDEISRWGNIAMDPEALIKFPLLSDLSDPRMVNLYKAFEKADRLRPNIKSSDTRGVIEHVKGTSYDYAVRDVRNAVITVEKATVDKSLMNEVRSSLREIVDISANSVFIGLMKLIVRS